MDGKGQRVRYLCATGRVLRGSAGYEFCVVVLEQVFIQGHVFFFGENGVVGLQAVFGKHFLIAG